MVLDGGVNYLCEILGNKGYGIDMMCWYYLLVLFVFCIIIEVGVCYFVVFGFMIVVIWDDVLDWMSWLEIEILCMFGCGLNLLLVSVCLGVI